MPDMHTSSITLYLKQRSQIAKGPTEKRTQMTEGGNGVTTFPKSKSPMPDSAAAAVEPVCGFTGCELWHSGAGWRRISVEERAKRVADGR